MIEAPWLLPTQNVTGVVESSTNTRRMFTSMAAFESGWPQRPGRRTATPAAFK